MSQKFSKKTSNSPKSIYCCDKMKLICKYKVRGKLRLSQLAYQRTYNSGRKLVGRVQIINQSKNLLLTKSLQAKFLGYNCNKDNLLGFNKLKQKVLEVDPKTSSLLNMLYLLKLPSIFHFSQKKIGKLLKQNCTTIDLLFKEHAPPPA